MDEKKLPRPAESDWEKYWDLIENGDTLSEEFRKLDNSFDWLPEMTGENGKYGIRLAYGEVIVPPVFDNLRMPFFVRKGDLVSVEKDGKWGIIVADGKGTWEVRPRFDHVYHPDSLALVREGDHYGIYDIEKKEYFIPPECDAFDVNPLDLAFTNGIAICEKDGKFGVAAYEGIYTGALFERVDTDPFGYITVKYQGAWGWLDEKGRFTANDEEAAIAEENLF